VSADAPDRELLEVALLRFQYALDQMELAREILEAEVDTIRRQLRPDPAPFPFKPAAYTQAVLEALAAKPIGGVTTLYLKPGAIDDDVSKR
jgi:hypothetical protein